MNRPSSITWRPATTNILIGGLIVILIGIVVAYALNTFVPTTSLRVGSGVYHLWIADTDAELAQGLSGVESLKGDGGLLMKFATDSTWGIWMKDMKIPLDIVWLNKDKKVVYIVKNASPDLSTNVIFTPTTDARYVVELPMGGVEKAAIKTGDQATFDENDTGGLW
ncbi:MAG: DUF192 domain-containing protein [Candidatus Saccharimonadaceae bacterium]